jgi:TetR/AcrR family transcriptional regulator, repressor for uid operon
LSVVVPASRGPGRPSAAKAAETRKRVLRAAREVFSECGYDATTCRAIAARADLTRPAINYYFPNKRELYREVVHETNVVVAAGIERAQRETALIGRVSALIDATRQAEIENHTAAAFLITAALESQRHPELGHSEPDAMRSIGDFLSWAISDAIHRGELAPDTDAAALTGLLVAVLLGVGFCAGFVATREEFDTVIRQLRQLLAGGLKRRPAPQ